MIDPYIQKNGTLKNKLGIENYSKLNDAEKDITFTKFLNIEKTFKTSFDAEYLKSIHKHIFEDIFEWAGSFRTVPIYKEEVVIPGLSLNYTPPEEIENRLSSVLSKMNSFNWNEIQSLDEKSKLFSDYLTQIWAIHPFRDGNTRATLTFANQFAKEHGFPIDLANLLDKLPRKLDSNGKISQYSIRDKFVLAAIPKEFSPEPEHLELVMRQAMVSGITKSIKNLQKNLNTTSQDLEI